MRVGRERRNERVEPHVAVGVRAKPSAVCVCVCASLSLCVCLCVCVAVLWGAKTRRALRISFQYRAKHAGRRFVCLSFSYSLSLLFRLAPV